MLRKKVFSNFKILRNQEEMIDKKKEIVELIKIQMEVIVHIISTTFHRTSRNNRSHSKLTLKALKTITRLDADDIYTWYYTTFVGIQGPVIVPKIESDTKHGGSYFIASTPDIV